MTSKYNATVTHRADLTPGTILLRVKLDQGAFDFEPGQYTVLGLHRSSPRIPDAPPDSSELLEKPGDPLIQRAYTITANSADNEMEFVISLVQTGSLTPRLFALKEGKRIHMEPRATGIFTLERSSGIRDLLLVATGPAIAPYLSMLRANFPESHEGQYVVIHAAAVSWDLAFRSSMEELDSQSVHFTYVPVITEPDRDPRWGGFTGSIKDLLADDELEDLLGLPIDPDRFDVFLSGSPDMIESVTAELEGRGFISGPSDDPDSTIFVERYW